MPKAPKSPEEVLPLVEDHLKQVFGQHLISATLYGSAAGGEYRPGLSDLNILVVVKAEGLADLDRLALFQNQWQKKKVAPPLVVSPQEIDQSLDSFPLEFLNMKLQHRTFFGPDPLAGLAIDRADLRLQCERELRGKLLLLREAVLSSAGREEALRETALVSIKAFVAIFRGVLYLLGQEAGPVPADQVLSRAAQQLGLAQGQALTSIWEMREGKKLAKGQIKDLFRAYLAAVAEAAAHIDCLSIKEEEATNE